MTKVQIFKTGDGKYRSFRCSGHSGYAPEGEDIVCAAISAVVINTINCLTDLVHEDIECEFGDGDIICNFRGDISDKGQLLMDSMIHGLEWIRLQQGGQYLSYTIKEV